MMATVPRVIIQTHAPERPEDCHEWAREAMQKLVHDNPSFTHAYYSHATREEYIRQTMPEALRAYLAINEQQPQARADLFRYIRMYQEGGVYLDTCCCLKRPLEEVIAIGQRGDGKKAVLAHWGGTTPKGKLFCPWNHVKGVPDKGEFVVFCLIAPPRHPLFKRVVEAVIRKVTLQLENPKKRIHGPYGVLNTTGPVIYTKEAAKFMAEGNEDLVAVHDCIDDLGVIHHKEWPRIKWAVPPHRKDRSHYSRNRKVPVVVGDPKYSDLADLSALSYRQLQILAKKYKIKANQSKFALGEKLGALARDAEKC
jgi:hypothetical protein